MEEFINDTDTSTGQVSTAGSDSGTFDMDKLPEVLKTNQYTIPHTKVRGELYGSELLLGYNMLETFGQLNLYKLNSVEINADSFVRIKGFPYLTSIWLTDGSPFTVENFKGLDEETIRIEGSRTSIEKLVPKLCADPLEVKKMINVVVNMSPEDDRLMLRSHRCWVPSVEYKFECDCKDIPVLEVCTQAGYEYTVQQLGLNLSGYGNIGELRVKGLGFKGAYHGKRGTVIILTTEKTKETEIGCLDLTGIDVKGVVINNDLYIRNIKGFENVETVGVHGLVYEEIKRKSHVSYKDFCDHILKSVENGINNRRRTKFEDVLKIIPTNPVWANDPNIFITKKYKNELTLNDIDPIKTFADVSELKLSDRVQSEQINLQAAWGAEGTRDMYGLDRADDRSY